MKRPLPFNAAASTLLLNQAHPCFRKLGPVMAAATMNRCLLPGPRGEVRSRVQIASPCVRCLWMSVVEGVGWLRTFLRVLHERLMDRAKQVTQQTFHTMASSSGEHFVLRTPARSYARRGSPRHSKRLHGPELDH